MCRTNANINQAKNIKIHSNILYLGTTAERVVFLALTRLHTVGSPGVLRTWQVARRTKLARSALTEAEHTVTVAV